MKKNIVLLICTAFFIGFIAFIQISLGKEVEWTQNKTLEIQNAFDDPSLAMELYEELDNHWSQKLMLWGMILPHDSLQDVDKELKKLGVALQNQNKENAEQAAAAMNLTMIHLLRRNTLRWDHIF